jgi:Rrf2 family protein
MKLSPAAEFAIRGATVLAENYGNGPVTLDTICTQRDLPKQYLVKIFAQVARAGLITPVRGKNGGYLLAKDPESVSLLDIIEAVEGPMVLNQCQGDDPQCGEDNCPMRPVWDELQESVTRKLRNVSLAAASRESATSQS